MTIPITLLIIGICLALSALHQLNKPRLTKESYQMQIGFLIIGIIWIGISLYGIIFNL